MKIAIKTTVAIPADPRAAYNRMKAEAHKAYTARIAAMKKSGMTDAVAKATMKTEIDKRREAEALQRAVREHMGNQRPRGYATIGEILATKRG